jgi:hypothetical protein
VFIIKFNKMIRNKWIWGIFATIVALAFAGSDFSCSNDIPDEGLGALDGKTVRRGEYESVRRFIAFEIENDRGSEAADSIEREVWLRLAALRAAEKMGVGVSDEDVARVIHDDPTFHDQNRVFNENIYHAVLRNANLSSDFFEEMLRQRIVLARLEQLVAPSASWVPPSTLALRTRGYTDVFTLCTAVVSNAFNATEMEVAEEEARAFYEKNSSLYALSDQRQVVYAPFKARDYLDKVSIAEEEIFDFYDANISRYVVKGTNDVETTKPLEDVRDEIEEELATEESKYLAYRAAAEFSDVFYTNRSETLTFEAAAAAAGYACVTSRLFTAEGSPVILEASPAFVEAAFALEPGPGIGRFSEAVNGGAESYVMGFVTNIPAHIRPFEAVERDVYFAAKRDAAETAFQTQIDKIADAMNTGLEAGREFSEIAAEQNLVVSTNFTYSLMDSYGETDVPAGRQIATVMASLNAGDVFKGAIPFPEGAVFFKVVDRQPGEKLMFDSISRQVSGTMFSDAANLVWTSWLEANLVAMRPDLLALLDASVAEQEDEYAE